LQGQFCEIGGKFKPRWVAPSDPISPFSCHFLAIKSFTRHFLAMNRPIPTKWLEPFRLSAELGALDYEAAFTPRLNRLLLSSPSTPAMGL
jgi:hypothetical protein